MLPNKAGEGDIVVNYQLTFSTADFPAHLLKVLCAGDYSLLPEGNRWNPVADLLNP